MDNIEVLVCDDSALMRNLISRIIDSTDGMTTIGTAMNGKFCLQKIPQLKPDLILLDIEMPEMTGVQFLEERKKQGIDIPVVILSSIATKGAAVTMQCLDLGASDFITKPGGSTSSNISSITSSIIEKIASYGSRYARRKGKQIYPIEAFMQQAKLKEATDAAIKTGLLDKINPQATKVSELPPTLWQPKKKEPQTITPEREPGPIDIVAIGISTGGPNALREVLAKIDPKFPKPILIVQHMPAGFTKEFASSLDRICPLNVKEAEDGDLIHPGQVYVAPGDYHIKVEKSTLCNVIRLSQEPQRNGHRPSADVLFESVAKMYKNRALGVIMTGMGKDGAVELAEMRKQGAWTLGQDEKSAIVYGMPRAAFELGAVQKQVSLEDMASEMNKLLAEHASH
ncbi:MAG: chemotaxis response regulator protein-glutamate methylesterase [Treponema sp.]|uniref:Protein-glutamate methylesterase/protein-glutamine glutaminase n=1 Tax=Treponema rectale TaxID=744512 RepID=A0A840SFA5_9SPIR|nr:chemotaxis response regulator protein-glutamate methylesterase [Treponema rectale]MBB5218606.1 two-component system chemotaxis response regulator CheB [Treponema rectale]MBO6176832.1 chemotaxis response regulator protein-glutamate methylesterase [Treponema sp.]